jgi:hypothetical protein
VGAGGLTACGARACPSCGTSGVNVQQQFDIVVGMFEFECDCGYTWVVRQGPGDSPRVSL